MNYVYGKKKMHLLIVSHDAGGAEIVSAWVKANPQNHYYFILQGPAVDIFSRKIANIHNSFVEELTQILLSVEFVLTGTSWGSDLEQIAIKEALLKNIFVAAYLDHWVNYLERFLLNGIAILPNEIWVGDEDAENLAKNIFKKTTIRYVTNQYFIEIKKEFKKISVRPKSEKLNILYLCEPVEDTALWKTGDKNSRNYTEFSALEYFFNKACKYNLPENLNSIKLRPHPSELAEKYDTVIEVARKQCGCEITVSQKTTLLEDFAWADWVVGVSSMALVVATILKKKVFTCIPENAAVTMLPILEIKRFDKV
ncbi:MAG: hypothetical protein NTZ67_08720 [Gammaproteobacteria bacterium]|nr:hypothetical protein [Gammaproteobacteria bacterium]